VAAIHLHVVVMMVRTSCCWHPQYRVRDLLAGWVGGYVGLRPDFALRETERSSVEPRSRPRLRRNLYKRFSGVRTARGMSGRPWSDE
jgi:hypothetical protein